MPMICDMRFDSTILGALRSPASAIRQAVDRGRGGAREHQLGCPPPGLARARCWSNRSRSGRNEAVSPPATRPRGFGVPTPRRTAATGVYGQCSLGRRRPASPRPRRRPRPAACVASTAAPAPQPAAESQHAPDQQRKQNRRRPCALVAIETRPRPRPPPAAGCPPSHNANRSAMGSPSIGRATMRRGTGRLDSPRVRSINATRHRPSWRASAPRRPSRGPHCAVGQDRAGCAAGSAASC